jgi:hypothetical protein
VFWHTYHTVMNQLDRFHSRQWFILLLGVVLWGLFCMRGFGSRTKY